MEEPVRTRRSFTDEFKRDAVAMVLDDGNKIVDVAGRLGVGEGTLGNWVRQARIDRGERAGMSTAERAELAELRRENARLRMERDLLISQNGAGVKCCCQGFRHRGLRLGRVTLVRCLAVGDAWVGWSSPVLFAGVS
jgi:transposase-like protein